MKISVVGGGSWGLALSKVLSDNSHEVLVYDINEKIVKKITKAVAIDKYSLK